MQDFWRRLEATGQIYKGTHSGWYAVSDECFYTEAQTTVSTDPFTGEDRRVATESGSVVEWTEEENYKFRLGDYTDKLINWLETNPRGKSPSYVSLWNPIPKLTDSPLF